MRKLSSKSTFLYKKILPILWFGILVLFVISSQFMGGEDDPGPLFIIMPVMMAVIGYFILKYFVFDLIDEVYDKGDSLLFKNAGKEVQVSLRDIKKISYQTMTNPPRVTLSLRHEMDLGKELSFSPPKSLIPFKKNRDIEELIDRIDQARG
jgi:hypothetical protein